MPTVAVYLKAKLHRALLERNLDVDSWVRAAVYDAIAIELDGGIPPEPNYEARIRKETRLAVLAILKDLVEEGTHLGVPEIQGMIDIVVSREPGEIKPGQLLPDVDGPLPVLDPAVE